MKILVPVSGGKDSQACLKMAVEKNGVELVEGLFCDTQFEHPLTYKHIDDMREMYGVRIHRITGGSVEDKILKYGRFPGGGARHCTDELKIRETRLFLTSYSQLHDGVQVWYGMRLDESHERSKRYAGKSPDELYPPHEVLKKYPKYLAKLGVQYRLPIVNWSDDDVFEYLDGEENPLYDQGFDRVGCFPCLAAGDRWKMKAFEHDDFGKEQRKVIRIIEEKIGKSVWTSGIGARSENQGCLICQI